MNVVRGLERRLERLLNGVAGRVFSGKLHPSEIATRLAREADFARFEHDSGPATANVYSLTLNPRDLVIDPTDLEELLAEELERYTTEEGLRLEGPCRVTIGSNEATPPGGLECHVEVVPGPPVIWGHLITAGETLDLGRNRVLIGRSETADVPVAHDDISRRQAVIFRKGGRAWITDLGSANGTTVDGRPVRPGPVPIENGSFLELASHRYRFVSI